MTLDLLLQNNEIIGTYTWIAYRLAPVPEIVQPISITGTPRSEPVDPRRQRGGWPCGHCPDRPDPARPGRRRGAPPGVDLVGGDSRCSSGDLDGGKYSDLPRRDEPDGSRREGCCCAAGSGQRNSGHPDLGGDINPGRSEEQRITEQIAQLEAMTRDAAAQAPKWLSGQRRRFPTTRRVNHRLDSGTGPPDRCVPGDGVHPDPQDGAAPNTGLLWGPDGEVKFLYLKTKRVLVEGGEVHPWDGVPDPPDAQGVLGMIICFDIFPRRPGTGVANDGAR